MSEEIKFDLDGDIIMQIEMDSYMKYNDTIASMNEHLGEIYGYSDVRDTEEAQLKYEKELAYKAIVQLQQKVEQLEKENKELRDENKRIFQNVNDDELLISNAMNYAELKKAEKRVEQLENIRKEAIEFVMQPNIEIREYRSCDMDYEIVNINLLNILNKGSDK